MANSEISAFLDKRGRDLRRDDIDELRAMLTQVPPEQYDAVAGWTWEAVALVVNDPDYHGDAYVPEPEIDDAA